MSGIIKRAGTFFLLLLFSCTSMMADKESSDGSVLLPSSVSNEEIEEEKMTEGLMFRDRETSAVKRPGAFESGDLPDSSGLKAGFADDNKQFNYFLNFLEEYSYVNHYPLKIEERISFKVQDSGGFSLPNVPVEVSDSRGHVLSKGVTYADGIFHFYPSEYDREQAYLFRGTYAGQDEELAFSREGKRFHEITFPVTREEIKEIPLDILFIMDTTGSMGEEINRLKTTIEIINMNLASLSSRPQVRFGMVLYKDRGEDEEYITQIIPLTGELEKFRAALNEVYADGGGDYPEDLQSALEDTINKIYWNKEGIRLAFIITDAPPHLDYNQEYTYVDASREAASRGIKIFSVGTGGLDEYGEYILRQISQYTYAKYIFLTYGEKGENDGGRAGSVSHHTGSNWQADKLESIIIRFAKEELGHLTGQPLEEDEEYFQARKVEDETKEATLKKLFDMALDQLVDYSAISISSGTTAAVIPLSGAEEKLSLNAEYFTDQLVTSLGKNETFTMVERKDIQIILKEMELQLSGLVDEETAVRVGAHLGAEMLITGKVYLRGNNYEIFLKLLRVETAEVLGVTKAVIQKDLGL